MLVLTRKKGERVMIGSNMSVTVLDVQGSRVKLGIDCPRTVPVFRDELVPHLDAEDWRPIECCEESEFHPEFA